ncbi:MAG: hypothetical protein ACIAS6_01240 [Phycisphaerales bacterium JB060]
MSRSLNLSLTDESRSFVGQQSGPGAASSTPNDFLRALILEQRDRLEAASTHAAVLEGYSDIRAGRVRRYEGDLRSMLTDARRRS